VALHRFRDADCRFVSKKVGCVLVDLFDTQHKKVMGENRAGKRFGGVAKPTTRLLGFWQRCDNALRGQKGDNVGEFSDPMLKRP
jgi:hypothetical protein